MLHPIILYVMVHDTVIIIHMTVGGIALKHMGVPLVTVQEHNHILGCNRHAYMAAALALRPRSPAGLGHATE